MINKTHYKNSKIVNKNVISTDVIYSITEIGLIHCEKRNSFCGRKSRVTFTKYLR